METEPNEPQNEEVIEPGKPIRPDPGSRETRGGSMETKTPEGVSSES